MSKVSVIVPAYNVGPYISKSIRSLQEQSYKNVEIIVVDDGSTDDTGKIIDQLSQNDERIKVLHKQNAGVSAARNSGLEVASGEFIAFLDGDDYLASDFVITMLDIQHKYDADFCFSTCYYTKEHEPQTKNIFTKQLTSEEGTVLLLSPEVIVGCHNKLYRKSFLDKFDIRFNTSLFYGEGLSFITTVAQRANCIGITNKKMYYYRKNNALSATTKFGIEKMINGEESINLIRSSLIIDSKRVRNMLEYHLCLFCLAAVVRMKTGRMQKQYPELYAKWYSYVRKHSFKFLLNPDLSLYRKILVIAGAISPAVLSKMDVVRRKRIFAKSIKN